MNLLDGLSALNPEALITVIQAKTKLEKDMLDFAKLEKRMTRLEIKHADLSERLEDSKAGLDQAIVEVQKAAEEARMAENALRVAQKTVIAEKDCYNGFKRELRAISAEITAHGGKLSKRDSFSSASIGSIEDMSVRSWDRASSPATVPSLANFYPSTPNSPFSQVSAISLSKYSRPAADQMATMTLRGVEEVNGEESGGSGRSVD